MRNLRIEIALAVVAILVSVVAISIAWGVREMQLANRNQPPAVFTFIPPSQMQQSTPAQSPPVVRQRAIHNVSLPRQSDEISDLREDLEELKDRFNQEQEDGDEEEEPDDPDDDWTGPVPTPAPAIGESHEHVIDESHVHPSRPINAIISGGEGYGASGYGWSRTLNRPARGLTSGYGSTGGNYRSYGSTGGYASPTTRIIRRYTVGNGNGSTGGYARTYRVVRPFTQRRPFAAPRRFQQPAQPIRRIIARPRPSAVQSSGDPFCPT